MLKTHERIITAQDLAQSTPKAIANAQKEPLVVTENGRPAVYMISIDLFDALVEQLEAIEHIELKKAIAIGAEQFDNGTFKTLEEATALAEEAWKLQESSE
ncbi:MAG: type II toxin-antitoxin system Phd/YefM family antitoxin [Chloroflexi bacterium]|nr:type II toxin-antitoxin system Phd/YefM family antitoxin [Chloroflexota bacterium]